MRKQLTKHLAARPGYTYTHIDATPTRKAIAMVMYLNMQSMQASITMMLKWDASFDIRGIIDRPGPRLISSPYNILITDIQC